MTKDEALIKAASALEELNKKVDQLSEKIAYYEKKDICEKLAKKMVNKNHISDSVVEYQDKVAQLMKEDNLDVWEKAIDINIGGLDLGSEDENEKVAGAHDQLTALLLKSELDEI